MIEDRENAGYRSICKAYAIDDGWKKIPEVIIEEISFSVQREWNYAYIQALRKTVSIASGTV